MTSHAWEDVATTPIRGSVRCRRCGVITKDYASPRTGRRKVFVGPDGWSVGPAVSDDCDEELARLVLES